jgi:hypothetical protein
MGWDGDGNGREDENTGRSLWRLVRRGFDLFNFMFFAGFLRIFFAVSARVRHWVSHPGHLYIEK